jgi:hypothetical protein
LSMKASLAFERYAVSAQTLEAVLVLSSKPRAVWRHHWRRHPSLSISGSVETFDRWKHAICSQRTGQQEVRGRSVPSSAASATLTRTEPGRERLAVHAQYLAVEPDLPHL